MDCTDGSFPAGLTGDPTMADPPLDWMLANKKGWGDMKVGGSLGSPCGGGEPFLSNK